MFQYDSSHDTRNLRSHETIRDLKKRRERSIKMSAGRLYHCARRPLCLLQNSVADNAVTDDFTILLCIIVIF